MTRHAVRFNLRHGRCGHLFQNRYKSIVVEEEPYFLELVRYVALNPVRAGVIGSIEELDRYPWNGHAIVVGTREADWQAVGEVLGQFAPSQREAVGRYREFVGAGWNQGRRDDLTGGGLVRSAGGAQEVARRRPEEREAADERVLGSGAFVEEVWRAAEQLPPVGSWRPWQEILEEVARKWEREAALILGGSRERRVCRARREFFLRSLTEAGQSVSCLGDLCGMNPASVSRAVEVARAGARRPEGRPEEEKA
ncbi:MAG: hypothetical protein AB1578_22110 [Thermodesulfobacteriota bacterium]